MIVVDTSGVIAAVDPRQAHHEAAARVLLQPQRRILSPFVLAELDYLISTNAGGAEAIKLLRDVARGAYELQAFSNRDVSSAIDAMERYGDLDLGLADASVLVLAGNHDCFDILALDHWHFRAVVSPAGQPLRLLAHDAG